MWYTCEDCSHLISALAVACINSHVFVFFAAHCVKTKMAGFVSHLAQNLVPEIQQLLFEFRTLVLPSWYLCIGINVVQIPLE